MTLLITCLQTLWDLITAGLRTHPVLFGAMILFALFAAVSGHHVAEKRGWWATLWATLAVCCYALAAAVARPHL